VMSDFKYTIQCHCLHGWETTNPEDVYDTREEAQEAIDDLISMTRDAAAKGDMDEAYDPEDWRVVEA